MQIEILVYTYTIHTIMRCINDKKKKRNMYETDRNFSGIVNRKKEYE